MPYCVRLGYIRYWTKERSILIDLKFKFIDNMCNIWIQKNIFFFFVILYVLFLQGIATGKYHGAILTNTEEWEVKCIEAGRSSGDLLAPIIYCPELHFTEFTSALADMKNSVAVRIFFYLIHEILLFPYWRFCVINYWRFMCTMWIFYLFFWKHFFSGS